MSPFFLIFCIVSCRCERDVKGVWNSWFGWKCLQNSTVQRRLRDDLSAAIGAEPEGNTHSQRDTQIGAEYNRWGWRGGKTCHLFNYVVALGNPHQNGSNFMSSTTQARHKQDMSWQEWKWTFQVSEYWWFIFHLNVEKAIYISILLSSGHTALSHIHRSWNLRINALQKATSFKLVLNLWPTGYKTSEQSCPALKYTYKVIREKKQWDTLIWTVLPTWPE